MDKQGQLVCEVPGRFVVEVFSIQSGLPLVLLDLFISFKVQNFALFSELHEVFVSPFLQSLCIH